MSINLPSHYAMQFGTNVALLLQQKGSRLRNCVTVGNYVGKKAEVVSQYASIDMVPVTSRFAAKTRTDANVDRRWIAPSDFNLSQQIDTFDKLRLLIDPSSQYVQNALNAAGRKIDNLIIDAFFDAAQTGEQGATSTSFAAGNVVGVNTGGTASNLNVAKIRAAKKLLMSYNNDFTSDEVWMPVTASQHDALLNETQIISLDYNDRPVLVDGMIDRFLGVKFVHTELLETGTDDQAGTSRAVPMFMKSGMHLGIWNDITTDIHRRYDIEGNPWEADVTLTAGATRIEENKVIKVWCRE